MRTRNGARRAVCVGALAGAALACVVCVGGERVASASFFDVGIDGGIAKRSLSDTDYKTSFAWQLHAELAFIPPILMVGPYIGFNRATPDIASKEDPAGIDFRAIGLRAKVKIPIPGPVTPYGVVGVGWVHGTFPDQKVTICDPRIPASAGAACPSYVAPSATADFAELTIGGGVMVSIAGPLAATGEFTWRPSFGYKNDAYEKQIAAKSTNAPDPGRNGAVFVAMLGLALSF